MKVELLHATPLVVASTAIRMAWDKSSLSDSTNNVLGEKDKELIYRVGNKFKHSSTLEHVFYNFEIDGISRGLLQELARHRIASLTVKSTRYTLKELKNIGLLTADDVEDWCVIPKSLLKEASPSELLEWKEDIATQLNIVQKYLKRGLSNDKVKYMLPESYKTKLVWSINMRSLQNFLSLRTDKSALEEIRDMATEVYNSLHDGHKYMLVDYAKTVGEET